MEAPRFTVGADPEVFLANSSGKVTSSIGRVGGSKDKPAPLSRPGFFVQEDNVALEFNIPPASTLAEFVDSIEWSISHIRNTLSKHDYNIVISPSAIFSDDELTEPQARAFGCTPDFNAWTGRQNPAPTCDNPNLRSCGGHVHVGWELPKQVERLALIQAMDLYLGVPSVLLDKNTERRKLYGKAGCFRPTDYGAEYRTLSNFWLSSRSFIKWVYEQTEKAFNHATDWTQWPRLKELQSDIETSINANNVTIANRLIATHKLVMPSVY